MFPGNMASCDPCSWGNMVKTTPHHAFVSIFWSNRNIRWINTLTMLLHHKLRVMVKTHLVLLFREITKQILTVSLDQHWKIMSWSCAVFGQHCTTSGHHFSMLPMAPVSICMLLAKHGSCDSNRVGHGLDASMDWIGLDRIAGNGWCSFTL